MGITYNTGIVRSGLVLHLDAANVKSYPGSGSSWYDLSKTQTSFTISGPDFINTDPKHFSFLDNQTDNIYHASSSVFNNLSQLTTSLWFRLDSTSVDVGLISYAITGSDNEYLLFYRGTNNPKQIAYFINGLELFVNYNLTTNYWYNIVNVVDTTTNKIYINGNLLTSQTKLGTTVASGGYLILGQDQDTVGGTFQDIQDLIGDISAFSVYNRALSATEIQQNFEALRGRYKI